MNKESILYGIIGLLVGVVITGFTATTAVNGNNRSMMQMMGMHNNSGHDMMDGNDMSMSDMTANLKGKSGDDFDKAFISNMITHHQGAVDMANLAKQNAKHDDIKNLANTIITTQTNEINKMKSWQQQWGYGSSNDSNMHDMMH